MNELNSHPEPDEEATETASASRSSSLLRRTLPPSLQAAQERQQHRLLLRVVRVLFLVILIALTVGAFASEATSPEDFDPVTAASVFIAALAAGVLVLTVDALTPNKRLLTVVGIYLGICAGLLVALAIGAMINVLAEAWDLNRPGTRVAMYVNVVKIVIGVVIVYLTVSIVLTTKDDFRLVIPYVEFAKQIRGIRPLLIDTSVLIDGRIEGLASAGFIDAPVIVPQFVINELQTLADSGDKLKRARGRRGLTLLSRLQETPFLDFSLDSAETIAGSAGHHSVDHLLLKMAKEQNLRILTTDYNLNKVAQIQGVTVLNINDIAAACKSQAIPGDTLAVEIVKEGEGPGQGVGYMPDGTMVVVENARAMIGQVVNASVTNSLQTTAGRMIFAKAPEHPAHLDGEVGSAEAIARAATNQPRVTERPSGKVERYETSRRNPRR